MHIPLWGILTALATAIIGVVIKKPPKIRVFTIISIAVIVIANGFLLYQFRGDTAHYFEYSLGAYPAPWGNTFRVSVIEVMMSMVFGVIIMLSVIGGARLTKTDIKYDYKVMYYVMINVLYASIMAMIYSNDIFTTYVFLEINAMASFGIIVLKGSGHTIRATLKYFVMSSIGSGLYLFGCAMLYGVTGHLAMGHVAEAIQTLYATGQYTYPLIVAFVLIFLGLAIKSALYPFHSWLPDAHSSATTTSSAILSGVVLKGYIITAAKFIYRIYGPEMLRELNLLMIIVIFGFIAMIIGSVMAIVQTDFKKMIAYSSVSQVGYIFVGFGLGTTAGLLAAFYHVIAHAITKSGLFLIAGNTIYKVNDKRHKQYYGIGKALPVSFAIFTLFGLSMVGIPPSIGFLTKWNLGQGLVGSGLNWGIILIIISSLLNAIYFLTVSVRAFFMEERVVAGRPSKYDGVSEDWIDILPIAILVTLVVLGGIYSQPIISLLTSGIQAFV